MNSKINESVNAHMICTQCVVQRADLKIKKEYVSNKISMEYTNYCRVESTCIMRQERQFEKR